MGLFGFQRGPADSGSLVLADGYLPPRHMVGTANHSSQWSVILASAAIRLRRSRTAADARRPMSRSNVTRRQVAIAATVALGAVVALALAAALIGNATPRRAAVQAHRDFSATPVPAGHGIQLVSASNHSATVSGYTWPCMTYFCPGRGASAATLLHGKTMLARMSLHTLGLTERFDFYLSNVPNDGAVVTVRLNNGTSFEVNVTRGSQPTILFPPIGTPPRLGAPI